MSNQLKPTSGAAWRKRKREGMLIRFPGSGNIARVRSTSVETLLKAKRIPEHLTPIVAEVWEGRDQDTPFTLEKLEGFVELQEIVTRDAFLEPRIVDDPKEDDEIGIDDVESADQAFLVSYLNRPLADLEPFRAEQKVDVESVDAKQVNGRKAKQATEAKEVGQA